MSIRNSKSPNDLRDSASKVKALVDAVRAGSLSRREFLAKLSLLGATAAMSSGLLRISLPSPAMAAVPKKGGTLIIGVEGEPATACAHLATDTTALMIADNVFSGLIGVDFDFNPKPDLAKSCNVSPDGLIYTFNLAQDATWHDGKPVTAEDVEYTINDILAKVHPRASSWYPNVKSASAKDKYTFEIQLKSPYAPMMTVLATTLSSGMLVMPKHIYKGSDPKSNPANYAPIGSGAFKFVRWDRGSHVELERNPKYFKKDLPYLDRVIVKFMPDAAARLIAFERGEVDFLNWYIVPYEQVGRLRRNQKVKVVDKGGEGAATNEFVLFNLRNQYLKDVRVRQAIAHAVDRQAIVQKALFGEGMIANSFVNSGLKWIFDPSFDVFRKPDVAAAERLLDEAGFKKDSSGKRFELRTIWATGRQYEGQAAEIIRDNLSKIGISVRIEASDRVSFIDKVFNKWDFDMAHQLFTTGPDPTISVTPRYATNQIKRVPFVNAMGYSNPQLDDIFDREVVQIDREKRAAMWRDAQKILFTDLPALPLFEVPVLNLVSAAFNDVITDPFGYIQSRENAYMA